MDINNNYRHVNAGYRTLAVNYDQHTRTIWCYLNAPERPCFTPLMLRELKDLFRDLSSLHESGQNADGNPVEYLVMASNTPGIFNLGGDLSLFIECIEQRDRERLLTYGHACVEMVYLNSRCADLPICNIALLQGQALGGGFEAALSFNHIIAEEQSVAGFPEILFNMFPGMGAYSIISRRLGDAAAERLILSGKSYSAAEMHDMGLVHEVCAEGEGEMAVRKFIKRNRRMRNGFQAVQNVRRRCSTLDYQELRDIVGIWVDTAMNITRRDLQLMRKLVNAQNNVHGRAAAALAGPGNPSRAPVTRVSGDAHAYSA